VADQHLMVLADNQRRLALTPVHCRLHDLDRALIPSSCWSFDHPLELDLGPQIVPLNSTKDEDGDIHVTVICPSKVVLC